MSRPFDIDELDALREGWDFEAKKAAGRDGRGVVQNGVGRGTWYTPGWLSRESQDQSLVSEDQSLVSEDQSSVGRAQPVAEDQDMDALVRQVALGSRWAPRDEVRAAILALCRGRHVSVDEVAATLNRAPRTVLKNYLRPMVAEGLIEMRYPSRPRHPDQAYRTVDSHRGEPES